MPASILHLDQVRFRYRRGSELSLRDLSCTLATGELLLVAGGSGSGKSTLLRCINGLIPRSYTGDFTGKILLDVFAQKLLSGNLLALVVDAPDLSQATMQQIAREFNQSETIFLLPPTRQEANWRLRSFTPVGKEGWREGGFFLGR